jgi:hypothetical protein
MPDKSDDDAVEFDAFFTDEFGKENTSSNMSNRNRIGLHRSKFTIIDGGKEKSQSGDSRDKPILNMADPDNNGVLKARLDAKIGVKNTFLKKKKDPDIFSWYFSKPIVEYSALLHDKEEWDKNKPINITLFFGIGSELNRSGIRSFFRNNNDFAAIIVVPGVEIDKKKKIEHSWGISLTDNEIAGILTKFFRKKVPYRVVIMSAYSAGMNGFNQTILNELLDLTNIKRVIIYDCLFENASGPTVDSLKKIRKTNSNSKIIIYWATISSDSNSLIDGSKLKVVEELRPNLIVTMSSNVISLAHKRKQYRALVCARILQAGVAENLVELSESMTKAFGALKLPTRGEMISDKNIYNFIYGSIPSTKMILDDWYNKNKKEVEDFHFLLDQKIRLLHPYTEYHDDGSKKEVKFASPVDQIRYKLMGWHAALDSELHDLLIPEFGWEYLPFTR